MRFGSIDSAYVMIFLQRGYAGVVPFVALSIVTLINLLRVALPATKPHTAFAGAVFGAMFMLVLTLFTSWFSPDFGSAFLFTAGISARIHKLPTPEAYGKPTEPERCDTTQVLPRRRFSLVPGHPPQRNSVESPK
jgi:O-antigen ligase